MGGIAMCAAKICHTKDLLRSLDGWRKTVNTLIIRIIHRKYHIEPVEVPGAELPCTMRQIVASRRGRTTHSLIGKFARMTAVSARRIALNPVVNPLAFNQMTHNTLGRRRAANIAQAYKKQFCCRFHVGKNIKKCVNLQFVTGGTHFVNIPSERKFQTA